jgi:hypothetical protein
MGALTRESQNQFRVRLGDLEGGALRRLFGGERRDIDPYVVARAVVEVMRRSNTRSPAGHRLLWNEYRVILAPEDFEHVRSLQDYLFRELQSVLETEAARLKAEMVGDLCVHVVVDEARELSAGHAVVRVAFASNEHLAAPEAGEMTVRLGAGGVAGEILAPVGPHAGATVPIADLSHQSALVATYQLSYDGGGATLYHGVRTVVGRPHPGHPPQFVPLRGASPRVNKQHIFIVARAARAVVGRFPGANPVHIDGRALGAGEEIELASTRVDISLSLGDFALTLMRLDSQP